MSSESLRRRSRTSSGSSSEAASRPSFYVDVSLGARAIPEMVRALGYEVLHKNDVFGSDRRVEDVEWIKLASDRNWVVLPRTTRSVVVQRSGDAFRASTLRVFCLTNGNLTKAQQVACFTANWERIMRACERQGPFLYALHYDRIQDMALG